MIETDPLRDQLRLPDPVPDEYSENLIMMGYDETSRHAFYWHFGRMHQDPDLWEAIIVIYRPGGEIVCRREFGTEGNNLDIASSGSCSFTVEEPLKRWRARYDGKATRTTTVAAARGFVGEEDLAAGLAVDMTFDAVFDTFSAGQAMEGQDWGDGHLEQGGQVTGEITVDGETTPIDCLAFRDHTWGRRNYSGLDKHAWNFGFFPSGRVYLVLEAFHDPDEHHKFGFVVQDGKMIGATPTKTPPLDDPAGEPRRFTTELDCELGPMSIDVEMVHAMPFYMGVDPLEMPPGTNWDDERNTINVEGPTVCEWNGERGTGWIERTNRIRRLTRPEAS